MKKMLMVVAATVAVFGAAYAETNCNSSCTCGCEKNVGGVVRRLARPWDVKKCVAADLSKTNATRRVRKGNGKSKYSKPFIQVYDDSITNGVLSSIAKERVAKMRKMREARKSEDVLKAKREVDDCIRRAVEYQRKKKAEEKDNGGNK